MAIASDSGVLGTSVYVLDDWTPYEARARYLRGAAAGLVCHPHHLETRYSFRTRVLDYIWAGIPLILSDGGAFAAITRAEQLGAVVPPEDPHALAAAVLTIADQGKRSQEIAERVRAVRPQFTWQIALQPLLSFCDKPRRTRHLADAVFAGRRQRIYFPQSSLAGLLSRTVGSLRTAGPAQTWRRVRAYVGRRASTIFSSERRAATSSRSCPR
jgi:hypothetical protein